MLLRAGYVAGACDVSANYTGICLFRASDGTLSEFTPATGTEGLFFRVGSTLGQIDADGVYHNKSWPLGHLDAGCPDLFPFGDQYGMLLTYGGPPGGPNSHMQDQWWVGDIDMKTLQFVPTATGLVDCKQQSSSRPRICSTELRSFLPVPADGNIFACKSGTVEKQSGSSRRVLFGFPGWTQRTKPPKAPKCLNLPREMTLDDGQMRLAPVHEMTTLRRGSASGGALASGSQVEVRLSCGWAASGAVGVDVLVSTDGAQFTRVAYNYTAQQLVVDQRACCGPAPGNGVVQTAPMPLRRGEGVELAVFVDGYMVQAPRLSGSVAASADSSPCLLRWRSSSTTGR